MAVMTSKEINLASALTGPDPDSIGDPGARNGLLSLVLDAVQSVEWPGKGTAFSIRPDESYQSDLLMAVITYCYAAGVYGSFEVESSALADPTLRNLCGNSVPDWKTIRRFRRLHRESLRHCLVYVVHQAFRVRFGEDDSGLTPADHFVAVALDRWFEPLCAPHPDREASDRIDRALFVDEMISD